MPTIQKMIVHQLNLSGGTPILSNSLVDIDNLPNSDIALEYFKKHIKNNRTQSATKKSKFKPGNAFIVKNSVMTISQQMDSPSFDSIFITESQRIAEHFANSISGQSSSDGSVVVLLYTYQEKQYIGILKMDPNKGIQVKEMDGNLTIEVHANILPSIKEKLHKSAFIILKDSYDDSDEEVAATNNTDENNDAESNTDENDDVEEEVFEDEKIDLFILDKQQSKEEVAKFFMNDFLAAVEVANNDNLTAIAQKSILEVFEGLVVVEGNTVKTIQNKAKLNRNLIQRFNSNEEFDLDTQLATIVNNLIPTDLDIEQPIQRVKNQILRIYPDAVFRFVPNPKKVKSTLYKSEDSNVKIEITGEINEGTDFEFKIDPNTKDTIFIFKPHLNIEPK
ncbi:MAG: nucleoid-associated protein [Niallia sp.]